MTLWRSSGLGIGSAFLLAVLASGVAFSASPTNGGVPPPAAQPPSGAATGQAVNTTPQFSLSLSLLGGQAAWSKGKSIVASVTAGPVAATGLFANVVLTDDVTLHQLGGGDFDLCTNHEGPKCTKLETLPASSSKRVYLRPSHADDLLPGKYAGTVQLVANQGKTDAVAFIANYTSVGYMVAGGLLIAAGCLLSLLTSVFLRNRLVRLKLLESASVVRARLELVASQLKNSAPKVDGVPDTLASLEIVKDALSAKSLDKASLIPRLWSFDAASYVTSVDFKARLDTAAAWTLALSHVVNLGFVPLTQLKSALTPASPATAASDLATAWKAVDQAAKMKSGQFEPAPDLPTLDANLAQIVTTAEHAVLLIGGGATAENSLEHIQMQVDLLSFASWAVAALLTILVGTYVMVISHIDFGRPTDLWLCLFWGLGLPTVAQLGQATPSSIASSLGITLPKPVA